MHSSGLKFLIIGIVYLSSCTKLLEIIPNIGDTDSPATRVTFSETGDVKDPEISLDGKLIYFASNSFSNNYHIYEKGVNSTMVKQITFSNNDERFPAINPVDPNRIAFCSFVNGEWDIFVIENFKSELGKWIRISERGHYDLGPSWSPDGNKIAYCSARGCDEWIIKVRDLTTGDLYSFEQIRGLFPKWSPEKDDSRIVFQKMREREGWLSEIWTFRFEDGLVKELANIVNVSDWAAVNPSFSPDGKKIIFSRINKYSKDKEKNEADDLWKVNVDGSNLHQVTHGRSSDWQPVWSTDGKIYFTSNRAGHNDIWCTTK